MQSAKPSESLKAKNSNEKSTHNKQHEAGLEKEKWVSKNDIITHYLKVVSLLIDNQYLYIA